MPSIFNASAFRDWKPIIKPAFTKPEILYNPGQLTWLCSERELTRNGIFFQLGEQRLFLFSRQFQFLRFFRYFSMIAPIVPVFGEGGLRVF